MNFFERRVETLARRVKRIGENPDPTKMKSNLLMYEVELERWQWLNEAWKEGKPFVFAGQPQLMRAMGFYNTTPRSMADRAGPEMANRCLDLIRREGYPEMCCDRAVIPTVLPQLGDFPTPALIVATNAPCDHAGNCYKALAHQFNIPLFVISASFRDNDAEALHLMTADLGELIEYAESAIPGIKYDEDKMLEYMDKDKQVFSCFWDIYQLLKRVPCPIDPREGFREAFLASNCPNPDRAIEWAKARRDELCERAEKGIGGLADEKLRTVWLVTGYNNDRAPLDYLESRGVAVLMRPDDGNAHWCGATPTFGDETQYGRKLSPLEEMARDTLNPIWLGLWPNWVNELVRLAKDLKIDFVINFIQSGCTQTLGLPRVVEERLQQEVGIPSLRIEGRGLFTEGYNRDEVLAEFRDFIDMMLERKGITA